MKKVLILESDLLLNAGVKNLLMGRDNLDVYELSLQDMGILSEAIIQYQPDVIIADEKSILKSSIEIINFLKMVPRVKTILINLEDNRIEIFDKQQIIVRELSDFLSALQTQ